MKKLLYSLFILSTITISAQTKKFFTKGKVQLQHPVEKINLKFDNNLPFVKVSINGKMYNFLFDSGSPTVISHAIYNELNLTKKYKKSVKDSNETTQQEIFTELPEMIVDEVVFKNIGAIVLDLNSAELGCLKVDGIIGANQMAKLFWRVNYSDNSLETTDNLSLFDLKDYSTVIPFEPLLQKTPVVKTRILDENIDFILDTGFSGRFEITKDKFHAKKIQKVIETFGSRSTGAFGSAKDFAGSIFKTDVLTLGNGVFRDELIFTSTSDRMGNEFLRDFSFIFDWKNNRIYMKRIKNNPPKLDSFGFTYRFIDQKPVVAFIFQQQDFPLKIGDSIISINDVVLDNLDQKKACYYFINRVEKDQKTITVKIRRDGKILDFKLDKKEYLN